MGVFFACSLDSCDRRFQGVIDLLETDTETLGALYGFL